MTERCEYVREMVVALEVVGDVFISCKLTQVTKPCFPGASRKFIFLSLCSGEILSGCLAEKGERVSGYDTY